MKKKLIVILYIITFILEAAISLFLFKELSSVKQDTIKINESPKTIEEKWNNEDNYDKKLEYYILDLNGDLIYKTKNLKVKA